MGDAPAAGTDVRQGWNSGQRAVGRREAQPQHTDPATDMESVSGVPSGAKNLSRAGAGDAVVLMTSTVVDQPSPTARCDIIPLPGSVFAATGMVVKRDPGGKRNPSTLI
jgi:hypothetical protein